MTSFKTSDKMNTNFVALSEQELMETDGGIGIIAAGLIVLGVAYGSGLIVGLSGR
ncbi:class IIb bacteriocin, lactobin A/cerein 7B family [Streptococcus plurextorum]|uniref:class IIb bacteriocin, lactobin A/cerein 7B family n=1 Tax=Streptococcus plurextorum TaxID=456876 RepID=UPI000403BC47|nr:class IIb bacteriocin, lactobin A/cerein 7B family [Streptococcus plurextorum]